LCAIASATAPIPNALLKEWSQFKADDQFYEQMDAFLEEKAQVGSAGGDFEFKCETTCQLVQKSTGAASAASLLQTEEGTKDKVEDAFYKNVDSFLETQQTSAGGDFEFKCETTCQLVQKGGDAAPAAGTNNFLQTEAGLGSGAQQQLKVEQKATAQVQAKATAQSTSQQKDCYRLCLNPSMNPGCDAAANVVSLLETGTMTEEELVRKNWSLGSGAGNCLNSCVHVCMAVHDSVRA
jgi:hypothetical protein